MQGMQGMQTMQTMPVVQGMQGMQVQGMPAMQVQGLGGMPGMTAVMPGVMSVMPGMQVQGMQDMQGMQVQGMQMQGMQVQGMQGMPDLQGMQGMQGMQTMQGMQAMPAVQGMQSMPGMVPSAPAPMPIMDGSMVQMGQPANDPGFDGGARERSRSPRGSGQVQAVAAPQLMVGSVAIDGQGQVAAAPQAGVPIFAQPAVAAQQEPQAVMPGNFAQQPLPQQAVFAEVPAMPAPR
eukprot:gnl/TRDRNA2_/TRDRNA2_143616_c2_seq1.p1 gnl/TRDRNA2_/TRDRNA2_143616_c2~~gnl/TRDRNA2_/TRDRNA2_143616_c2_seq1.p1  ORF type:complete len:234 (+),score=53.56 gnl/TRDRNA2_/TRDRNA2_143616_c2_seq1:1-702(+)